MVSKGGLSPGLGPDLQKRRLDRPRGTFKVYHATSCLQQPYLCPGPVGPPEEGVWRWSVDDTPHVHGPAQPPLLPDLSPGAQ